MTLTLRMAMSGMLIAVEEVMMTVGLFTVVKKVDEDGLPTLRLVFDQRIPNEYWQDPPWTPLAGPGALASIDLSEEKQRVWQTWIAQGDVPDCFYRWGIPPKMAEWFVIPDVDFGQLKEELARLGQHEVVEAMIDGRHGKHFKGVGLKVAAMGWSWAVFLAQSGIMAVAERAGTRLMKELGLESNPMSMDTALVEGGPGAARCSPGGSRAGQEGDRGRRRVA